MDRFIIFIFALSCISMMECVPVTDWITIAGSEVANRHNEKRALHRDTPLLSSSYTLSLHAKDCAVKMFEQNLDPSTHPCQPGLVNEGENIYVGTSDLSSTPVANLAQAMNRWYDEYKLLGNLKDPDWIYEANSAKVGHVTQILWRSTRYVGCAGARAVVGGNIVTYIVCRYSPQGNDYRGSALLENVMPLKVEVLKQCSDNAAAVGLCSSIPRDPDVNCGGPFRGLYEDNCPSTCGLC